MAFSVKAHVRIKTSTDALPGLAASKSGFSINRTEVKENVVSNEDPFIGKLEMKVSPLDFNEFFPWMCRKMGLMGNIHIIRKTQEKYVSATQRKGAEKIDKMKNKKSNKLGDVAETVVTLASQSQTEQAKKVSSAKVKSILSFEDAEVIVVRTYYDFRDHLAEILIRGCNYITQKHIKVINLVVPFHLGLKKMTLIKCCLSQEVIYEISQLLPISKICDVCLDDTRCRQGNYYVLLDYASSLKRLSLNRCSINDIIVEEIFKRLQDGSIGLQILELSSNFITDKGAATIGDALRTNRELLHLNLSGNRITDIGAVRILNSLMKFRITDSEIAETRKRKLIYAKKRAVVYGNCYAEQLKRRQQFGVFEKSPATQMKKSVSIAQIKMVKSKKSMFDNLADLVERTTNQIMGGPFKDVFDDDHVIIEDDMFFSIGNLKLSSLNLAYNNLELIAVRRVLQVLKYQVDTPLPLESSGLVRIVLDGNNICRKCEEYDLIAFYLYKKIARREETPMSTNASTKSRIFLQ